jgi:hypothetical protein
MKKLKLNKTNLLFLFLMMSGSFMAQSLGNLTNDWKLIQDKDGVQFFAKTEECKMSEQSPKPFDIAFLKIVNNTNKEVEVAYNFVIEFTEGCNGCDGRDESRFSQKIPANGSIVEDCNFKQEGMAHIIRNQNFDGGWNFEKVSVANVTID